LKLSLVSFDALSLICLLTALWKGDIAVLSSTSEVEMEKNGGRLECL